MPRKGKKKLYRVVLSRPGRGERPSLKTAYTQAASPRQAKRFAIFNHPGYSAVGVVLD